MSHDCNCQSAGSKYAKTVTGALERPLYAPGLVLQDTDLTAAVDYTRELNRMLFRHLFGCGVICGLEVTARTHCDGVRVEISPGLALDGCGDPVHLAKPVSLEVDEREAKRLINAKASIWVVLCGKEKQCAPRSLVCDADDFDAVSRSTRARAMAEVSLVFEEPKCICRAGSATPHTFERKDGTVGHCVDPYPFDCADDCGCGSACSCGCCILLGRVEVNNENPVVQFVDVRRVIRPMLMPDSVRCPAEVDQPKPPVPPPPPPPPPPPAPVKELTKDEEVKLDRMMQLAIEEAQLRGWDDAKTKEFLEKSRAEAIAKIIAERT